MKQINLVSDCPMVAGYAREREREKEGQAQSYRGSTSDIQDPAIAIARQISKCGRQGKHSGKMIYYTIVRYICNA